MRRTPRRLVIARWRRALLAALFVLLASVIGLYVFGRTGRTGEPRGARTAEEPGRDPVVLQGEGFDHEFTRGDERIFRIRGDRILSDRARHYQLEGVRLTFFREDGSQIRLESAEASYDLETEEAELRGAVRLAAPDGLELRTEGLALMHKGRWLESTSAVEFRLRGSYRGRADQLTANLSRNLFRLVGDVSIESLPGAEEPASARCQMLLYERDRRLIRMEEEAEVRRGEDLLRAHRINLFLAEDESRPTFIGARWGVWAQAQRTEIDGRLTSSALQAKHLSLIFDAGGHRAEKLELEGTGAKPARLESADGTGLVQRVSAPRLVGSFGPSGLERLEAFERVEIDEFFSFDRSFVIRRVCSREAVATMGTDRSLSTVQLTGELEYREGGLLAQGDGGRMDLGAGSFQIRGEPARLLADVGEVEAPRFAFTRAEGILHAEGGVRASMAAGSGSGRVAGGALGPAEGPVRVEAREAFWRDAPRTYLFRGEVRAWQGESLLLAEELRGDPPDGTVSARGGVKTFWNPQGDGAPDPPGEPIEISAEDLLYQRPERILTYRGGARAHRAGRLLTCGEIEALLEEGDEVRTLICRGGARIEDPAAGKTAVGERAVYDLGPGIVRMTGEAVTLEDREGSQVQGRLLTYDLGTGVARMESPPREEGGER